MNIEKNIVAACFLGATLGAFCALHFSHHFWWLGILIGGAIAYFSFRWREVLAAIYRASTEVIHLKPNWPCLKLAAQFCLISFATYTPWLVCVNLWAYWSSESPSHFRFPWGFRGVLVVSSVICILCSIVMTAYTLFVSVRFNHTKWLDMRNMALRILWYTFPLVLVVWHIPRGIIWATSWGIKRGPCAFRACVKIGRKTLFLIHSEIRLLCMADAIIGALVGYCFKSSLFGGVVGSACGVLHYRFISMRWFKPANQAV